MTRIKDLDGVRNFRDFGVYNTRYGGMVKAGKLFRSGHYAEATDGDIARLEAFNIAVQADLRRPDERERMVAKWPGDGVRVITNDGGRETDAPHQRFLEKVEASAEAADNWMNEYYKTAPFKPHHKALFSDWFDAIAGLDGDQAALVNCAAGKDRTGIICMLTHHVLGVSVPDIFDDYELTNTAAKVDERLEEAQTYFNNHLGKSYGREVYRPFMGVHRRYLQTAIDVIETEAGSIDAYLIDSLGVGESQQDEIRKRLIE